MKGHRHLTIVIKLGTSSIVDEKSHEPVLSILSLIVETAVKLRKDGHRVVIVSSGAIGVGLRRMDIERRPKHLPRVQALAAVGQCRLMSLWDSLFGHLRQPVAQILLTRNDIADRTQYLNAQNTFVELLNMGVIPIVNENDTIAVSEIKFGDNDTLSAITAAMVQADYLFLMTDVDCLYDKNPRTHPDAQAIEVVEDISVLAADVSTAGSSLGTGGMSTKIVAARLATSAGVTTVITRSSNPGNIVNIINYVQGSKQGQLETPSLPSTPAMEEAALSRSTASLNLDDLLMKPPLHTRFLPDLHPIRDRSFWLLHGLAPRGIVYIDEGAHRALADKAGLLPVGVVDVEGQFSQHEAVRIVVVKRLPRRASISRTVSESPSPSTITADGSLPNGSSSSGAYEKIKPAPFEVGRALVNYSAAEIARIKGLQSTEIQGVLGYADSEHVALRENISLSKAKKLSRPATPSPAETQAS
ncbi:glutamate 5-kinase [Lasallia pustulata]|uniref:Glutamate 5-kinase n=1 Tax=Lasallia pustulata TaxID=136370 RepID=A0A1W5D938_9LECA|nr:glutamate 5-kinase [Lasallia pustulata]